jgi:predicted hydrocarbon binding protein
MNMRRITDADKLFYFERNFFTLDGLWMIETENETDWDTALKIDTIVWKRLLRIIMRRLKKYLNIKTNTVKDLVEILTFRWSVEGWKYDILKSEEAEAVVKVLSCPYREIMKRNPERQEKIPLICKNMCIGFYEDVTKHFNPNIELTRTEFMGLGGEACDFTFKTSSK